MPEDHPDHDDEPTGGTDAGATGVNGGPAPDPVRGDRPPLDRPPLDRRTGDRRQGDRRQGGRRAADRHAAQHARRVRNAKIVAGCAAGMVVLMIAGAAIRIVGNRGIDQGASQSSVPDGLRQTPGVALDTPAPVPVSEPAGGAPPPDVAAGSSPVDAASAAMPSGDAAAVVTPSSTISVSYEGFTANPAARQAFQAAAEIWGRTVWSPVPITVRATFGSTNCSGATFGTNVLGSSGPATFSADWSAVPGAKPPPVGNTWYPAALANAVAGVDLDPATVDLCVSINSKFPQLYFGVDGRVPADGIDFETIVLHELGHGLGLIGSMRPDPANPTTQADCCYGGSPFAFDRFTTRGNGTAMLSYPHPSAALFAALTSGDVYFRGPRTSAVAGAGGARLYAPGTYSSGSSYAHLDEVTYPLSSGNALMTPAITYGEAVHVPGPIVVAMMADLGWPAAPTPTAPGAPTAIRSVVGDMQITVSWTAPGSDGGSPITSYTATASPGGASCTWSGGPLACVVSGLDNGTAYTFRVTAANASGSGAASAVSAPVTPVFAPGTAFHPVSPARILDSRGLDGGWNAPLIAGQPRDLVVTDRGGPSSVPVAASAVVMNVTATGGTAGSFLTAYPAGAGTPNASNLNFGAGQTIANLVTVKIGPGGAVAFANAVGSVHVVADVVGYYDDGTGAGDLFTGITPTRLLDSRTSTGGWGSPLVAGRSRDLVVRPTGTDAGVPATATAVVVNVTATNSTAGSFVTVWPSGQPVPNASNVNFATGQTIPNLAVVKIGTNGAIQLANAVGAVDVIVDAVGYFDPSTGSRFHAMSPARVLDDRVGTGLPGPWGPGQSRTLPVAGAKGTSVPAAATGLVVNVTATGGTVGSFVTVYPDGVAVPNSSNVNFGVGETIPNLVTVKVPANGSVALANRLGSVDLVADAVGYYAPT